MAKSYKDGPVAQRSCTDLWCCFLFLIVTFGLIGLAGWAFTKPGIYSITVPEDPDGNKCGKTAGFENYPYIYFASPGVDSLWKTVCVSSCPTASDTALNCKVNSVITSCTADNSTVTIYDTTSAVIACVPTDPKLLSQVSAAINMGVIKDISNSWQVIAISVAIAVVIGVVFMCLMKYLAKLVIWILIVFVILALAAIGAVFLLPTQYVPAQISAQTNTYQSSSRTTNIIIGASFLAVSLLFLILICCFRKKINLAVSVTEVASDFVASNSYLALLPIGMFVVMIVFVILWIVFAAAYYSLGTQTPNTPDAKNLPFAHFQVNNMVIAILAVHAVYLLWGLLFFVETISFLVIGAAVGFYFQTESPFSESSYRFRRFHSPSVVKGAFLWTVIGWLKIIYSLLSPKSSSDATGCWHTFAGCCEKLWCCCVTYLFNCLDGAAYALIHLENLTYCSAAGQAIALKFKQIDVSLIVDATNFIFAWLARLSIGALTGLCGYLLLTMASPWKATVVSATWPAVIIFLIGLTIGSFFVSLYSEATTAIYICFRATEEEGGKCPDQMRDFIEEAKRHNEESK